MKNLTTLIPTLDNSITAKVVFLSKKNKRASLVALCCRAGGFASLSEELRQVFGVTRDKTARERSRDTVALNK